MRDAKHAQGFLVAIGFEAGAVVGHDAVDLDALNQSMAGLDHDRFKMNRS